MSNPPKNTAPKQSKDQHLATRVQPAKVNWKASSAPLSEPFDDFYYSSVNGLEETQYIFLQHNHIEKRFSELPDEKDQCFTIAETGFGTGLNFLATCLAWRQSKLENASLHFISVEKYPLILEDLTQALSHWESLNEFSSILIQHYPPLVGGFHRIEFNSHRIHLTLIFDDAINGMKGLNAHVDAWYLDGFTPSRNPDMWQPALFEQMNRLSSKGTTLATFTAAGNVRRGLEAVGFEIHKHSGFGLKREMVSGVKTNSLVIPSTLPHDQNPWYLQKADSVTNKKARQIAVIGAGLAGSATARALAQRGFNVTVIEKDSAIAQQASGNPVGMTFTRLSPFDNPQNRFYQKAYWYSVTEIRERFEHSHLAAEQDYALNGVLRFAYSEKEQQEQEKLLASGLWPNSIAKPLTQKSCEELTKAPCKYNGLYLTEGGWLTPADLCRINLSLGGIDLILDSKINSFTFEKEKQQWLIDLGKEHKRFDAIVLANSFGAGQFPGLEFLPLRPVRGQITYVPANEKSSAFKHALNYEGYITPAKNGFHCVGATFHPKEKTSDFRKQDHQTNLSNLKNTIPSLFDHLNIRDEMEEWPLEQGRVAFRCQSPDYLPIVGPVPDVEIFKDDYSNLRKGFLKKEFPLGSYLPNLYINVAHGSRGITSSILSAEIIASYINGEPHPIDNEVIEAIHPTRFAIRGLKRNQL